MSRKRFTKEQIEILSKNENVNKVSDKYIVFEADFKRLCQKKKKKRDHSPADFYRLWIRH